MSLHSFDGTMSTGISYFSHGEVKQINSVTSYTWCIKNFCICRKKNGEVIDSPIISAGADGEHRWRMLLYPKGRNEDSRKYLSVFLFLLSCKESKVDVQAKFAILNDKNEEHNERRIDHQVLHRGKGLGCSDFIKRDDLLDKSNGLLPNGNLTILIEITTGIGPMLTHAQSTASIIDELPASEKHLADDLEQLLEDQKYADVKLIAKGNREYQAHRNILAARSPVFAKMFDENSKTTVDLNDVEAEVLAEILRFIYTGKTDNILKFANSLLPAANRYEVHGLKVQCEDALSKELTIDNAIDTLIVADQNSADKLKTQAISFIIKHAKGVVETPRYKYLAGSKHLHLLAEVFKVLALENNSPKAC